MSDPTPETAAQETFLSHLFELRTRLLRSIVAVVVVLVCLFPFAKDIYALLAQPLLRTLPAGATMIATDVTGTFLVPLKVTLMAAFLIALPYVLWQAWAFVAPGLYHHEKRLALPVLVSSVLFFMIGMAFAYFFVFPVMFSFFAGYTPVGVTMMTDIDKYLSFVLAMFLAFGMTFVNRGEILYPEIEYGFSSCSCGVSAFGCASMLFARITLLVVSAVPGSGTLSGWVNTTDFAVAWSFLSFGRSAIAM